ncbi:hypothetical protein [Peribacillus sp. SCS-155]|uniref:hypothetical protein n=1 Tax=Peribacillus sedimenti TaxID=3115297 RepID=UPI0039067A47
MARSSTIKPHLLLGMGVASASFLLDKDNRTQVMGMYEKLKCRMMAMFGRRSEQCVDMMEKAGHPDPYDFEDNRMVDEGAMYSVNYYNRQLQHT